MFSKKDLLILAVLAFIFAANGGYIELPEFLRDEISQSWNNP